MSCSDKTYIFQVSTSLSFLLYNYLMDSFSENVEIPIYYLIH